MPRIAYHILPPLEVMIQLLRHRGLLQRAQRVVSAGLTKTGDVSAPRHVSQGPVAAPMYRTGLN